MLYSKQENKKYTQMAKEFDEEFYTPGRDDNKLFKYLYLIFYMLACKGNYFTKFEDYDGYAQYAATKIYARYLKKEKKGEQLKSVLNYAKSCKGHLKVDYQNETFEQVTKEGDEDVQAFQQVYRDNLSTSYSRSDIIEDMTETLNSFPSIAKQVIKESPYKRDKSLCKNLYMSCLLTFLMSITLSNQTIERLNNKKETKELSDSYVVKQYQRNLNESLVLWKLSSEYSDIVLMLVNKIRAKMSEEINEVVASNSVPDDVVDSIISSAFEEKSYLNYDESVYKYN